MLMFTTVQSYRLFQPQVRIIKVGKMCGRPLIANLQCTGNCVAWLFTSFLDPLSMLYS